MNSEVKINRGEHFRFYTHPIGVAPVMDENSQGDTPSTFIHSHDFNELVIIFSGSSTHVTEAGAYPVSAGDVFVIMAGEKHEYRNSSHLKLANVLYMPEALEPSFGDLRDMPGYHALFTLEPQHRHEHQLRSCLSLNTAELAQVHHLFIRMSQELSAQEPGFRSLTHALFMEMITFLCRAYSKSRRDATQPILSLAAVLSHIERHFDQPVTLADLANMANMSESTFLRTFRQFMNTTPIEYLLQQRIAHAAHFLQESKLRISEVAQCSGFEDSNYFSRKFRHTYGISPSEWRKRHQQT